MDQGSTQQSERISDAPAEWLAEGIPSLRGVVRQHVMESDGDDDALLRAVVRPIAQRSRTGGIDAAQLVVRFKQAWLGLPETDMLSRSEAQHLLDRAVTILIQEYYATDQG